MDDLSNLSRAELEQLARGLRRTVIAEKAANRRLVDDLEWSESQTRVYRRLAEKLLREQEARDGAQGSPSRD